MSSSAAPSADLPPEVSRGLDRVVAQASLTRLYLYLLRRSLPVVVVLSSLSSAAVVAANDSLSTNLLRGLVMLAGALGILLTYFNLAVAQRDGTAALVRAGALSPHAPAVAVLLTLELLQSALGLGVALATGVAGALSGHLSWSAALFLGATTAGGGTLIGVLALLMATFVAPLRGAGKAAAPGTDSSDTAGRRDPAIPYAIFGFLLVGPVKFAPLPATLPEVWQGMHSVLFLLVLFVVTDLLALLAVWLWQRRAPRPQLTAHQRAFLAETLGVASADPLLQDTFALHRRIVHLPDGVQLWEGLTGAKCLEFLDGMRGLVEAPPRRDVVLQNTFGEETVSLLATRVEDLQAGQAAALLRAWAESQDVEAYILGKF